MMYINTQNCYTAIGLVSLC